MLEGRAGFDERHGEVELEAFRLSRQRQANRVKQRLSLRTRLLAHARGDRAECVPIRERTGFGERFSECGDYRTRFNGFGANARNGERCGRRVVEHEMKTR